MSGRFFKSWSGVFIFLTALLARGPQLGRSCIPTQASRSTTIHHDPPQPPYPPPLQNGNATGIHALFGRSLSRCRLGTSQSRHEKHPRMANTIRVFYVHTQNTIERTKIQNHSSSFSFSASAAPASPPLGPLGAGSLASAAHRNPWLEVPLSMSDFVRAAGRYLQIRRNKCLVYYMP